MSDFERCFHKWAKEHKAMIVCGHSHRAIFGSQAHATSLKSRISELKANNTRSKLDVATRQKNEDKIARLQEQLDDERAKGRVVEEIASDSDLFPCYFNSGCGLYTNGMTAIEIASDQIRLVKWCNDTDDTIDKSEPEEFGKGKLSEMLARIAAV
jgi:hypothetical protein